MVGAELMSATFLEALAHAGHEVTVYTDIPIETYERNGVRVTSRTNFSKIKPNADLVYSHPDVGSIGYIVGQMHRIPYVATVHNTGDLNRWHLGVHKPTLTIWNSESTRQQLDGQGGLIVRSPLVVKDHAVKTPGESFTLINCIKDKGVDTFTALVKAHPEFPALAVRGGYGLQEVPPTPTKKSRPHTPTPTKADPSATPYPVAIGPVPHEAMAKEVWSKTKVLLMPSKAESWGRAGVEALCSGIPVIAHPTPGLKESLGDAGIFVDRDDIEGWSLELKKLMTDSAYFTTASKKAKARARFLEKQTADDLLAFIAACESLTLKRA
jgi:glycosyltransferase involved in cell wall biosynthesis